MTFKVLFVGIEKLTSFAKLTDFFRNPMLKHYRDDKDKQFHVQVVSICSGKGEAMRQQSNAIRAAGFPNANKYSRIAERGLIVCHETGDKYHTLKEAAEAMRIDPTNLSRHLRNMPGFKSVKGYTFSRASCL